MTEFGFIQATASKSFTSIYDYLYWLLEFFVIYTFCAFYTNSSITLLPRSVNSKAYWNSYFTSLYDNFLSLFDVPLTLVDLFYAFLLFCLIIPLKNYKFGTLNFPIYLKICLMYSWRSYGKSSCKYFGIDFLFGLMTVFHYIPSKCLGKGIWFIISSFYIF